MKNLKWFMFHQTNSGGYHVVDKMVAEYVFIQAENSDEANKKMDEIIDQDEERSWFCDCCGERWGSVNDSQGYQAPSIWGESIFEYDNYFEGEQVRLHHANGKVSTYIFGIENNE